MIKTCPKCKAPLLRYVTGVVYKCGSQISRYDGKFFQSRDCVRGERDRLLKQLADSEARAEKLMDVLRNHVSENDMGWWLNSEYFACKPQCKTLDDAMEELLR